MLKKLSGAAVTMFAVMLASSPATAATSSQTTRLAWDCANEFEQNDGDAGGSSGEVRGYWTGLPATLTARFRAYGEVLTVKNDFAPRWVNVTLYRLTPNGNILIADATTDQESKTRDLNLAEGLKVFIRMSYNGNRCNSNVFTT
ncbi:hypothetical protein [Spongiactinospora sp. TRM90649]|uniref:hypothetical protein n=1 Tax=Spongiactinospora sp. TRM90649 TaxID=3031114 RepID=UPI0023F6E381|nr:hypothetical protein [Spongiactinospora sp. TRM90649]